MILDNELIYKIWATNANKQSLDFKKEKSKLLRLQVTGIGAKDLIKELKDMERKGIHRLRKEMAITNVDLVHRVLLPRKKIYTAKGGIEEYNLKTPQLVDEFKEFLANVTGSSSLKAYIRDVLQKRLDYDPEGLKWVEVNKDGEPYPCFKSINSVFEWHLNGRKPEYVFFRLSKQEIKFYLLNGDLPDSAKDLDIYRVVDDAFDRLISFDGGGGSINIITEVDNPFGFVPGEILSDIPGEEGSEDSDSFNCYMSPLQPIHELLSKYMFNRSVFDVAYARTAYPKEWMNKFKCPTCDGQKTVDSQPCPECNGTGALPHQKNSDTLVVEFMNDVNKNVPVPPMGVIDSPIDGLQFMKDNNLTLEEMIYYTLYGTFKPSPGTSQKVSGNHAGHGGNVSNTAFEANMNDQSKRDVLRDWGNWTASTIQWFVDIFGSFKYEDSYISCAILMGDMYMEESSDATFDRLDKARMGNAPKSQLNSLQIEYLNNKYQNNPLDWWKYYVAYIAEPFMWDKTSDVLSWDIPMSDKLKKIYFDEWFDSKSDDYFAALPRNGVEEVVKADLEAYMMDRYKKGTETDNLMFTSMGNSLFVGGNATVIKGKELSPTHTGKTFKISKMDSKYVTFVDDTGNTIDGYTRGDVENKSGIRGGEPLGIN